MVHNGRPALGLETVAMRYFNVVGERQHPICGCTTVIPHFIHLLISGEPPMVYADG